MNGKDSVKSATGGIGEVGQESSCHRAARIIPEADFRFLAVVSVVARAVVLWNLQAPCFY